MAQKSKIEIKELAKKGVLNDKTFYRLLSEQNNYIDEDSSKAFYMALVRVVTKQLREQGVSRLPHIGDLALVKQQDKMGLSGKVRIFLKGKYAIRFYVNLTWKKYFTTLAAQPGKAGKLDPREKVLDRKL